MNMEQSIFIILPLPQEFAYMLENIALQRWIIYIMHREWEINIYEYEAVYANDISFSRSIYNLQSLVNILENNPKSMRLSETYK